MARNSVYDSSVAMTIYNLLQVAGSDQDANALFDRAVQTAHMDLDRDQFERSLGALVRRRWIDQAGDVYKSRDPKRRIVVNRDRSGVQAALGVITGGWKDWRVRSQEPGGVKELLLEDVLYDERTQS